MTQSQTNKHRYRYILAVLIHVFCAFRLSSETRLGKRRDEIHTVSRQLVILGLRHL